MEEIRRDLTRTVLGVLFIGGLIGLSFWILRPFLGPLIWATTIVVSTWPIMLALQAHLWRRRGLAVAIMSIALLSVLVAPLSLAIAAIVSHADEVVAWVRSLATFTMPPPPDALRRLPLVGAPLTRMWEQLAAAGMADVAGRLAPHARVVAAWFIGQVGGVGIVLVEFLLTVLIAAILYMRGEDAAAAVVRFARRLAGVRGENAVTLAGQAVRGVALGVVVTALLQAGLGGIGLWVAGVPFAAVLTAVMFMLCIAQVGPALVLGPAVIWLYWGGSSGRGTVLLAFALVAITMDNFVRPLLIRKGADLPLLLIFSGVIGGLMAFGLIGIFVGPVVLAIAFTLLEAWVSAGEDGTGPAAAGRPGRPS